MMKKHILHPLLTAGLCLCMSLTACGVDLSDVAEDAWYAEAVTYVQEHDLMSGMDETHFIPNGVMSREILATVLYRMAGSPAVSGDDGFSDTASNTWYSDGVLWAVQEGVIAGYDRERFGLTDPVNREQAAAILWRYMSSPEAVIGTDFADGEDISPYAREAVAWAKQTGIVTGRDGNRFDPKSPVSRGEMAVILMNLDQMNEAKPNTPTVSIPPSSSGGSTQNPTMPAEPGTPAGDTVATAVVQPHARQTLYLWEEGNMPGTTEYTVNNGGYSDDPDFRPYLTFVPVPEGTEIKGAVLICPGGAFMFRSNESEGFSVARALSALGYQSFVVDYRLRPYTQEEGALDLARAVRFVRAHAEEYGIDTQDIAVMGFSAGGILSGEMLRNYDGFVNGTVMDPDYVPDTLDEYSADAAACGMIYSFYGRLSVGTTDVESLRRGELPPTFYCYGTRDPFYTQFLANADAAEQAGVRVERLQLDNMPHGFGATGGWIPTYDTFLSEIFSSN